MSDNTDITRTDGVKMQYLIARRAGVTRDELVANWFANHMPGVIEAQHGAAARGSLHATRYIATLFDPAPGGDQQWDGVAQLWWKTALRRPTEPHGTTPRDTFQQKAMPYVGWPTTELVVLDGSLPVTPNTLNPPFPFTRSGFLKITALLTAKSGADTDALFTHWVDVHAPNVRSVMREVGGFRYVISQSLEPDVDPHVGMAELWFPDEAALHAYNERYQSDGFEEFIDAATTPIYRSTTEMVGIA